MSPTRPDTGQVPEIPAAERLDSWKEIAAYLQRDESTLRRWAVRKGLPIHRQRVKSRITVYAFKSELDAWQRRRGGEIEGVVKMTTTISTKPMATPPITRAPVAEPRIPVAPVAVAKVRVAVRPAVKAPKAAPVRTLSGGRVKWLAVPVVLAFFAATILAVGYTTWPKFGEPQLMIRIDSLAVLPLLDVSSDAPQDYLADSLTELLTTNLAETKRLRVIAHPSMAPYKVARKPMQQLAEDLKVDAVVEGYISRTRDRVRITTRLIDARNTTLIWSNTYERGLGDVLGLSRQVAQAIAGAMVPQRELHVLETGPIAPGVPEAFLQGNYYLSQLSCEGLSQAITNFQQATAGAPNFALAHARLASTYVKLADFGCAPPRAVVARARASAARALSLDPDLAEAHAVLGVLSFLYDWDWWTAHSELKRATELNPNDAMAHAWYGAFLFSLGKQAEALIQLSKARNVDPMPGAATMVYAYTLYHSRWYDRAIEQFQRIIDLYPDSAPAYFGIAASYERKRMRGKALKNYLKAKELSGVPTETLALLRNASQSGGLTGFWQKELQLATSQPDICRSSLSAAHIGVTTQMLSLLERAYDARCSSLASLKVDPLYDRVRRESRFVNIMKRMGLPGSDSNSRKPANERSAEKAQSERTA